MKMASFAYFARYRRLAIIGVSGILTALGCPECVEPPPPLKALKEFTVDATIQPVWPTVTVSEPIPENSIGENEANALIIYLDLSRPMAGFLPLETSIPSRAGSVGTNEFRAVAQWIPDHLTRVYSTATLYWRGVGRDIQDLAQYPEFDRTLFRATASRLDLAIQEALTNLRSGRSEGAAVITDLLGTGELTGALAVSRFLSDWLASEGVRSGEFHLGLLGVKANYWGATTPACPPRNGLGCWYSERAPGWRRLEDVAVAPFYVLLIGRSAEALSTILVSIQGDAERLGIAAVSELLTVSTRRRPTRMTCEAFTTDGEQRSPQYALRRDEKGYYTCVRDDRVMLACSFDSVFRPTNARINESIGEMPEVFQARVDPTSGEVEVHVDCRSLRSLQGAATPDLLLDVVGTVVNDSEPAPWPEWSIETDDFATFPGKTLQLRYFIEEVRLVPDSYRTELSPLLRGRRQ